MADQKVCPYCGERIAATAKKCRYCGEWLEESKSSESKPLNPIGANVNPTSDSVQNSPKNNQFNYSLAGLNLLVIAGALGAIMQLILYLAPEWTIENICGYSIEKFISFIMFSGLLLAGTEMAFALMARNKIMKEEWDSKLPLWLMIYAIVLGITVLILFIGIFSLDYEDFLDDEGSMMSVLVLFVTLIPGVAVAFMFMGKEVSRKVGLGTLAVLAIDFCTEFFFDLGDLLKASNGSSGARILLLLIVGAPLYLFISYRDFLSGKRNKEIKEENDLLEELENQEQN